MRLSACLAAVLAGAALSGCNAPRQTGPVIDPTGPQRPAPASQQPLPEGAGCSAAIARYRSVMENDLSMGHVNQSVYGQIQGEISEAASACAAGQDAKATSLVRASKARHGYPGG
ncbi:hypothetical protein [Methylocystis echinoides]|uniref:Lipoprotein n=1 Tax=Methylocystis echinoides TaxID=29468 RepID=A0A9W6GR30_9HYPH|nr:hypothetical protein [Methylocystis echinoides]GLI91466.1 hypothetical protein LMG27198_04580 [Methylocystis echinoides]